MSLPSQAYRSPFYSWFYFLTTFSFTYIFTSILNAFSIIEQTLIVYSLFLFSLQRMLFISYLTFTRKRFTLLMRFEFRVIVWKVESFYWWNFWKVFFHCSDSKIYIRILRFSSWIQLLIFPRNSLTFSMEFSNRTFTFFLLPYLCPLLFPSILYTRWSNQFPISRSILSTFSIFLFSNNKKSLSDVKRQSNTSSRKIFRLPFFSNRFFSTF